MGLGRLQRNLGAGGGGGRKGAGGEGNFHPKRSTCDRMAGTEPYHLKDIF